MKQLRPAWLIAAMLAAVVAVLNAQVALAQSIEIRTVREWAGASDELRYHHTTIWTQALAAESIRRDTPASFAYQLYGCINENVAHPAQPLDENFPIFEIAVRCAIPLGGSDMRERPPVAMPRPQPATPDSVVEAPAAIPNPALAEVYTVGEWIRMSHQGKQARVAAWTAALAQESMVGGDRSAFGRQLLTCIDGTVNQSIQAWGENAAISQALASCVPGFSAVAATARPLPVVAGSVDIARAPTDIARVSADIARPLPVVATVPMASPTVNFNVVQPPGIAPCDCGGDTLNCTEDFGGSHAAAQACFNYCMGTRGYDVHRLDFDNDQLACEELLR